jgi:hypothetical protein
MTIMNILFTFINNKIDAPCCVVMFSARAIERHSFIHSFAHSSFRASPDWGSALTASPPREAGVPLLASSISLAAASIQLINEVDEVVVLEAELLEAFTASVPGKTGSDVAARTVRRGKASEPEK